MDDHFNELAEHWTKFLAIEADGNSELGVWASGNARDILGVAGMAIAFVCWLAVVMLLIFLAGLPYFMRGAQ